MKPISIKIEAYTPYSAEQTAEAFQKYCFSKDLLWSRDVAEVRYQDEKLFSVQYGSFGKIVRLYVGEEAGTEYKPFTLPSEWKAFTDYLDKYIEYHSEEGRKEALLLEAKKRYKEGDKVKCLFDSLIYAVSKEAFKFDACGDLWANYDAAEIQLYDRDSDKWAEVIKEEEPSREEQLEEALSCLIQSITTIEGASKAWDYLTKAKELLNKKP